MAKKSADNLLASIERARTGRSFDRLLSGLGIPLVGSVVARVLAEKYGDLRTPSCPRTLLRCSEIWPRFRASAPRLPTASRAS